MGGIGYRSDVDGLRAVAVGTVIANHAFERFCPGGFVGVDVFFVISGFLITAILVEETSTGTFR
ncbi:acyltransferase family protein [Bradyrhizobium sp. RDM4]